MMKKITLFLRTRTYCIVFLFFGIVTSFSFSGLAHVEQNALRPSSQGQSARAEAFDEGTLLRLDTRTPVTDLRESSGIELGEFVPVEERIQFMTIPLDHQQPAQIDYEVLNRAAHLHPGHYERLIAEMRAILQEAGTPGITAMTPAPTVLQRFAWFAQIRVSEILSPFAQQHQLDPHAKVVLEWGSRRAAHFHVKGDYEQKIILNINLLPHPALCAGECLHETLHPLVKTWLQYAHVETPELFRAAGLDVRAGVARPVSEGYLANVWEWDFQSDEIAILRDFIVAAYESGNDILWGRRALGIYRGARRLLMDNIGALAGAEDDESRAIARALRERTTNLRRGISPANIETVETLLRASIEALDTSSDLQCRVRAQRAKDTIRDSAHRTLSRIASDGHDIPAVVATVDRAANTLQARAMTEALAEVFCLAEELSLFDGQGRGEVFSVLQDEGNLLDPNRRFRELLRAGGDARIEAILEHVSNPRIYRSRPQLAEGAALLLSVWRGTNGRPRNPDIIKRALEDLRGRLANMTLTNLTPVSDMNGVVDRIVQYRIELIEVVFTDPEGRLQGQRKTVLMPVNMATLGILKSGVGFDASSIHSSLDGEPMQPIFESDYVARFEPRTFEKFTRDGKQIARIYAVATLPLANVPYEIGEEQTERFRRMFEHPGPAVRHPEQLFSPAEEQAALVEAQEEATRVIRSLGVRSVKLFVNDWSNDFNTVDVPSSGIREVFDEGVPLDNEHAQYLPGRIGNEIITVKPDPYSLRIIEYPNGTIEAVMHVNTYREDGSPFEGDFRARLQGALRDVRNRFGTTAYFSPEPEFFLLRRLEDGSLVTADASGYYSDLRNAPHDVQDFLDDVAVTLTRAGMGVRYIHHEVAPGQYEIPYEHGEALEVADRTELYMYIMDKIATQHGLVACFMPKPVYGVNGSGMHIHQSFVAASALSIENNTYMAGENVFFDPQAYDYFYLSRTARLYIAGLLKYAPTFERVTNPDDNSYRRIVPGFEAPTYVSWSDANRSCLVRVPKFPIPADGSNAPAARLEIRLPDPCGNIYAKFLAVLTAGVMGIEEGEMPPEPVVSENVFEMTPAELAARGITQLPGGPGGLGMAIATMNDSASGEFMQRFAGPADSHLRGFLSRPYGLMYELREELFAHGLAFPDSVSVVPQTVAPAADADA